MNDNFTTLSASELVRLYRQAAVAHGISAFAGDYRTANKNAFRVIEIYRELRRRGQLAQNQLLTLLEDDDLNVRTTAAAHALEFAPKRGEPVLIEMSKSGRGLHRLAAKTSLDEWRKGTLEFP